MANPKPYVRFRDTFESYIPVWLRNRPGFTVGYRFLWSSIAPFDSVVNVLIEGIKASWPGFGTPSALPYIGRGRGLIRGQADTDESFGAKLRAWLDVWRDAGSMEVIARQVQGYLRNTPRVRIVNRAGQWVTINSDGTMEATFAAFDWDSVSNPERAGYWSEMWIIVYPTEWADSGLWGDGRLWGARDSGIGHVVTRVEVDAIKGLIAQWKGAHSRIRNVIWTSDATLFNPADPASLPDGTWGTWSSGGSGSRVGSGRVTTTCRYWDVG